MKKSLGKRIVDGLEEFVDVLKKGESIKDKFVITKVVKKDGTYKFTRSKPKKKVD